MRKSIPSNWKIERLGDVAKVIPGFAFKSKDWCDNGIPVIKIKNIVGDLSIDTAEVDCVPSELLTDKIRKFALEDGDILVAMTGATAGKVGRLRCKSLHLLNQRVAKLAPHGVDPLYFWSVISSDEYQNRFFKLADGAAQPNMSGGQIESVELLMPPRPTQRKIAGILSAYDDLVENNTRRIALLEEMAQSIYREWFVHFRFPGHEQAQLIDSPLGKIPEGWKVVRVEDAIEINPRIKVPRDGEKPFVSMGAIPHNTMLIDVTAIEMRTGNSGSKFQNHDTLFARITPCLENGKTAFVQFLEHNSDVAFGSTEFIVLRSKTVCPEFVYLLARSAPFRDNAIKSMSGATGRQRVQEKCFDNFFFAHPDNEILSRFAEFMKPVFKDVFTLAKKNRNLRATRDLLLPKLISGQLDMEALDIDIGEPVLEGVA